MSEHKRKNPHSLRSARWFGQGPFSFGHRSRLLQNGYRIEDFDQKPVIAIISTWSDLQTCHGHFKERVQQVKRGVLQAGGFPVELPAMALSEIMMKPSTMLYRNLLALETEELLRSHPVDGAILMGGCDKTTPALLLGAISMNLPSVFIPAGFMGSGEWNGEPLGSGIDAWKYGPELLAGNISIQDWLQIEQASATTVGTCNTMGTASTMTAIAEALGFCLPGASSFPAVDARAARLAVQAGECAVGLVWQDLTPQRLLTEASFTNAAHVHLALGGSTNASIHLLALARRAGINLTLDDLDHLGRGTPVLANVAPFGKYLMGDFFRAGGIRVLLKHLEPMLDTSQQTVSGTLKERLAPEVLEDNDVLRTLERPVAPEALAVLKGNLAPDGAVIKPSGMDARFSKHRGKAVVFRDRRDFEARIDRDDLEVDENSVLVMQNSGPIGGPGMPEWGMLRLPRKLLQRGVRDMVRVSDARMSGTSYGTCVLHVAPESHIGGPLALVEDGDEIELDVEQRRLHVHLSDAELAERRARWTPPPKRFLRGYGALFSEQMSQAPDGCDFKSLQGTEPTEEPDIFV